MAKKRNGIKFGKEQEKELIYAAIKYFNLIWSVWMVYHMSKAKLKSAKDRNDVKVVSYQSNPWTSMEAKYINGEFVSGEVAHENIKDEDLK